VTGVTYRDAPHNTGISRDDTARRYREVCHEPSRRHAAVQLCIASSRQQRKEMGVCRSGASTWVGEVPVDRALYCDQEGRQPLREGRGAR
jgi:hypothetical protein